MTEEKTIQISKQKTADRLFSVGRNYLFKILEKVSKAGSDVF